MTYTDRINLRFFPGFIRDTANCIPFSRYIASMSLKTPFSALVLMAISLAIFSLYLSKTASAEPSAMEQLLQILSTKAVMTPQEVKTVREALEKEKAELSLKEKELEERRKALVQWEKDLAEKQQALQPEKVETAPTSPTAAETSKPESSPLQASYDRGFQLSTKDPDLFSLRLGGLLQTDYR
jgi:DNA-binding transcriptional MerR regulator